MDAYITSDYKNVHAGQCKHRFPVMLLLFFGLCFFSNNLQAQTTVSFQVFYDELSPYGSWVENPDYGYVWIPRVEPGFAPYATNGYWVLTEEGWTWYSNYPWGWAPFHYGRWYTDAVYGPVWVPDHEWGPGWVTWRRSPGYYGWAPISPGVSISVAYSSGYQVPSNHWRFVRNRDFGKTNIHHYYVNTSNNVIIINHTTVINNTRTDQSRHVTYNSGPDRTDVEKYAGRKISPVGIKESTRPEQKLEKNQLQLYRPQVDKIAPGGAKAAPAKISNLKDIKRPAAKSPAITTKKAGQPGIQQEKQIPQKSNQQQINKPLEKPVKEKQQKEGLRQPEPDRPAINKEQNRELHPPEQQGEQKPPQQKKQVIKSKPPFQQPSGQPHKPNKAPRPHGQ